MGHGQGGDMLFGFFPLYFPDLGPFSLITDEQGAFSLLGGTALLIGVVKGTFCSFL